jgi:hypothetical protein
MQSPAEALVNYLGIGELSFGLEPSQRRALLIISALPALLLVATLTQLGYEIDPSPFDPFSYNESRVYRVAFLVQAPAAYVGLAVMMIAGIGRIGRSEGSYCFVGAIVFAGLALLSGVYGSMVYALIDLRHYESIRDWHPDIALKFAGFAGLVAAGYAFLAFRGLAPRDGE